MLEKAGEIKMKMTVANQYRDGPRECLRRVMMTTEKGLLPAENARIMALAAHLSARKEHRIS